MSMVYLSDKSKTWKWHLPLWDGELNLSQILKKIKQSWFEGHFSLKLDLSKKYLADQEKVHSILKKCREYYIEHYKDITDK